MGGARAVRAQDVWEAISWWLKARHFLVFVCLCLTPLSTPPPSHTHTSSPLGEPLFQGKGELDQIKKIFALLGTPTQVRGGSERGGGDTEGVCLTDIPQDTP